MTNLDREVEKALADTAVRYTRGRRRVVDALAAASGPRSAAELHAELGAEVPLSSLYRSLAVLQDAEVVMPHYGPTVVRYELAEWLTGHHHHLVCLDCGAVDDVSLSRTRERNVQSLVDEIAAGAEFTPTNHAFEIEGRCARCA